MEGTKKLSPEVENREETQKGFDVSIEEGRTVRPDDYLIPDHECILDREREHQDLRHNVCNSILVEAQTDLDFHDGDECNPPEWRYHRFLICTHCKKIVATEDVWMVAELREKKGES